MQLSGNLVATDIKLPYSGFPTDIQSPFYTFDYVEEPALERQFRKSFYARR